MCTPYRMVLHFIFEAADQLRVDRFIVFDMTIIPSPARRALRGELPVRAVTDLLFATDTDLVGRRLAPAGSRFEPDLPFHGAASCTSKAMSVSRPAGAAQVLSTPRVVEGRDQVPRHAVIAARP